MPKMSIVTQNAQVQEDAVDKAKINKIQHPFLLCIVIPELQAGESSKHEPWVDLVHEVCRDPTSMFWHGLLQPSCIIIGNYNLWDQLWVIHNLNIRLRFVYPDFRVPSVTYHPIFTRHEPTFGKHKEWPSYQALIRTGTEQQGIIGVCCCCCCCCWCCCCGSMTSSIQIQTYTCSNKKIQVFSWTHHKLSAAWRLVHVKQQAVSKPKPIHGTMVYLPTWMVDFWCWRYM